MDHTIVGVQFLDLTRKIPAASRDQIVVSLVVLSHGRQLRPWKMRNGAEIKTINGQTGSIEDASCQGQHAEAKEGRARRKSILGKKQQSHVRCQTPTQDEAKGKGTTFGKRSRQAEMQNHLISCFIQPTDNPVDSPGGTHSPRLVMGCMQPFTVFIGRRCHVGRWPTSIRLPVPGPFTPSPSGEGPTLRDLHFCGVSPDTARVAIHSRPVATRPELAGPGGGQKK